MRKQNLHKTFKTIVALCLCLTMVITPAFADAQRFSDVEDSWASDVIEKWTNEGWINGYDDGTFKPNAPIARSEFVALVNRMMGFDEDGTNNFTDVDENCWAYNQIITAKAKGYVDGYDDGTFRPNNSISRVEAIKLISNILGYYGGNSVEFKDINEIPEWSISAVSALSDKKIITGYTDGNLKPNEEISRSEAVVMLDRFKEVYDNSLIISEDTEAINNKTIDGDVIITEDFGDGTLYLSSTKINGDLIMRGGGSHSINLYNCEISGTMYVDKKNVHVNLTGSSNINRINIIKEADLTLEKKAIVKIFDANAISNIVGKGTIQSMNINIAGVSISDEVATDKLNLADGVEKPEIIVSENEQSSSSSGSSGSSNSGNSDEGGNTPVEEPEIEYDKEEFQEMVMNKAGLEKALTSKTRKLSILISANIDGEVNCEAVAEELNLVFENNASIDSLILTDKYATKINLGVIEGSATLNSLTIDAPKAHVESNIEIGSVDIKAVNSSSFVANKDINTVLMEGKGKLVANAVIGNIIISTSENIEIDGSKPVKELIIYDIKTNDATDTSNVELNADIESINIPGTVITTSGSAITTSGSAITIPPLSGDFVNNLVISGSADIALLNSNRAFKIKSAGEIEEINALASLEIDKDVKNVKKIVVKKNARAVVLNLNTNVDDIQTSESITFLGKASVGQIQILNDAPADVKLYADESANVVAGTITNAGGEEGKIIKRAVKPDFLMVDEFSGYDDNYDIYKGLEIECTNQSGKSVNDLKLKYYLSKDAEDEINIDDVKITEWESIQLVCDDYSSLFDENGYGSIFISSVEDGCEESERVEYKYEMKSHYVPVLTNNYNDEYTFCVKSGLKIPFELEANTFKGNLITSVYYKKLEEETFAIFDPADCEKLDADGDLNFNFQQSEEGTYNIIISMENNYINANGDEACYKCSRYYYVYVGENEYMILNDINYVVDSAANFDDINLNIKCKSVYYNIEDVKILGDIEKIAKVVKDGSSYKLVCLKNDEVDPKIENYSGTIQFYGNPSICFRKINLYANSDITELEKMLIEEIGDYNDPVYIRNESDYSEKIWEGYTSAIESAISLAKDENAGEDEIKYDEVTDDLEKAIETLRIINPVDLSISDYENEDKEPEGLDIQVSGSKLENDIDNGLKFKMYLSEDGEDEISFEESNCLENYGDYRCLKFKFDEGAKIFNEAGVADVWISSYVDGVGESDRIEYKIGAMFNYCVEVKTNHGDLIEFSIKPDEVLNFDFDISAKKGTLTTTFKLKNIDDGTSKALNLNDDYIYDFSESEEGNYQICIQTNNRYIDADGTEMQLECNDYYTVHVSE